MTPSLKAESRKWCIFQILKQYFKFAEWNWRKTLTFQWKNRPVHIHQIICRRERNLIILGKMERYRSRDSAIISFSISQCMAIRWNFEQI
jgi:hypothetical protein